MLSPLSLAIAILRVMDLTPSTSTTSRCSRPHGSHLIVSVPKDDEVRSVGPRGLKTQIHS
ncbi:hypothetical protein FH972_010267 [Carpinus fangiana]|uniref:Uncharacterized protein n=1 Tax=Carpinus fangiana TaxID=176857 RepID=A0A660KPP9_9ROSI|nr:hypothetical protein FH972_010267 [Carpinus fangiana]